MATVTEIQVSSDALPNEQKLYSYLANINVSFRLFSHKAVFTVDESFEINSQILSAHTKNLFLKDGAKKLFLVSIANHKKAMLKELAKELKAKSRFSFASEGELQNTLQVSRGSVTPYGLIFAEKDANLVYVLDLDLANSEYITFHPLRNDRSLVMAKSDFKRYLDSLEIEVIISAC